tara:strand:- start:169 stop:384 length:216 start_codon:yes stop_codon:yes gene_type:complete
MTFAVEAENLICGGERCSPDFNAVTEFKRFRNCSAGSAFTAIDDRIRQIRMRSTGTSKHLANSDAGRGLGV